MKKWIIIFILLLVSLILIAPECHHEVEIHSKKYEEYHKETIELIKQFEGLNLRAYWDVKHYSIGYGHAILPGDTVGKVISQRTAEILLKSDFDKAIRTVERLTGLDRYVSPGKVLALSSFVYNVGAGNFQKSTLLQLLKDDKCIEDEFLKWIHIKYKNHYVRSNHLKLRRELELEIFNS